MKSLLYILLFLPLFSLASGPHEDEKAGAMRQVSGRVLDNTGQPVPGARITIRETGEVFYADLDGKFQLSLPKGESQNIEFTTIGFDILTVRSNALFLGGEQVLNPLQ